MKQYEDKINKILAGVGANVEECKTRLAEADAEVVKNDKIMGEALISGDDVAYIEAKEKRDKAEASYQVATARLNTLTRGPLISKEEYESMVSGILDEMTQLNNADKREAVKLCEKLLTIANRNLSMIEEGDKLLHKLQYDVYRAADIPRDKSGEIILDWSGRRDKQFTDNNSLNGWAQYALRECVQYDALRDSITV